LSQAQVENRFCTVQYLMKSDYLPLFYKPTVA